MVRPASTAIACPGCGQKFNTILEQIIDQRVDPTAKERLIGGRINLITCPYCGYRGMVGTPLLYHDPSKQLAIVYVPMELNLEQSAREKLIGDMTNLLMRSLSEDQPKGYLLQPKTALTLQGMVDQVLEADGVTSEMIDAERRKVDLITQLSQASDAEVDSLIADNQALIDLTFFELLTAAAQAASQAEDSRASLKLLNLRSKLMETSEAGQILQQQEMALIEASEELRALGENLTREAFVDLLVNAAGNLPKITALATIGRQLLDYTIFQLLTDRIGAESDPDRAKLLTEARERLLEINAEFEQQARSMIQRATDTLRMLMISPDITSAIRNNLDRIDDMFLQVLQVNLDEAKKASNLEVSGKLKLIRDEVLKLIQESAPPEVRFINDLLAVETDDAAKMLLKSRETEVTPQLAETMKAFVEQLRGSGNEPAAARLELLHRFAVQMEKP
jgi:hypothetical protein